MAEPLATDRSVWSRRGALTGNAVPGRSGNPYGVAGVRVRPIGDLTLATVAVARGGETLLADHLLERYGAVCPAPGRCAFTPMLDLVWSAPGQWLAISADPKMPWDMARGLQGAAAVVDQSDGRALFSLEGSAALDVLAKGLSIDLHPAVFIDGAAAATGLLHLPIQIWRHGSVYTVACARSSCGSVWSWLLDAAAEFGCDVEGSG